MKIRTGDFVLIGVSNSVTKTPKLDHAVEGPYQVLRKDQNTVVIQRMELVGKSLADRVAFAPL